MGEAHIDLSSQLAQRDWGLFGDQGFALGIDIGGYGLRAVLAQLNGRHIYHRAIDVPKNPTAELVLSEVMALVRDVLQEAGIDSSHLLRIGIGFGGPVDVRTGQTLRSHRMPGWTHLPVRRRFEESFDAVTVVENDANVIALGEATFGAGRHASHLFYLHLSKGVGGGLVLDGRLYHGMRTLAGEIGHAPMALDGPACACGGRGHLESFVSIDGLLRRAAELGLETQDLRDVFADGAAGRQTVAEAVQLLGLELARVVQLLDPELIVLGGIVVRLGGERFVEAIEEALNALQPPGLERHVPVVASSLGYDAVAVGGLALALESLNN